MPDIRLLLDIALYVTLATATVLGVSFYNPRLMLQDYPPEIKALVPPKTAEERRLTTLIGLPLSIVLLAYPVFAVLAFQGRRGAVAGFFSNFGYGMGLVLAFNIWDWLVIDWLIVCTITPRRFVLEGTEGHPAYKDYVFHFRGFVVGLGFSVALALVAASLAALVRLAGWG